MVKGPAQMGILGRSPSRAEKKLRGLWSGCRKGCAPVQVSKGRGTAEELCARQVWAPQGVRRPDASRLQLRCWSSGGASLGVPGTPGHAGQKPRRENKRERPSQVAGGERGKGAKKRGRQPRAALREGRKARNTMSEKESFARGRRGKPMPHKNRQGVHCASTQEAGGGGVSEVFRGR